MAPDPKPKPKPCTTMRSRGFSHDAGALLAADDEASGAAASADARVCQSEGVDGHFISEGGKGGGSFHIRQRGIGGVISDQLEEWGAGRGEKKIYTGGLSLNPF